MKSLGQHYSDVHKWSYSYSPLASGAGMAADFCSSGCSLLLKEALEKCSGKEGRNKPRSFCP
jgi:hypothetical protein